MASKATKLPLLSRLLHSTFQTNNANDPHKRGFRHGKTAPITQLSPYKFNLSLKQIAACLGIYMGVGTIIFCLFRDDIEGTKTNPIIDSIYFVVVTMTTVGYGDLEPNTSFVKVLASVFVFAGMAIVGLILSKAADFLVEKQQILLIKALNKHKEGPSMESSYRVEYKCLIVSAILAVLTLVGMMFLSVVEGLDTIDSIYCAFSTVTTLGFGDESFSTRSGRFFGIFWIMISTLGLGQLFFSIAEVFTGSRQKALVNLVLNRKITNPDLEMADIDNDKAVGTSEFIIYKFKEMGKITQEDILLTMKEFEDLNNVDQSGT